MASFTDKNHNDRIKDSKVNQLTTVKQGPGIYHEISHDEKGNQIIRKITIPEEMARENRQSIDQSIKDAQSKALKYEYQQKQIELAEQNAKIASNNSDKAQADLAKANDESNKAENNLKEKQKALNDFVANSGAATDPVKLSRLQDELSKAKTESKRAKTAADSAKTAADTAKEKADKTKEALESEKGKLPEKPKVSSAEAELAKSQVANVASTRGGALFSQRVTSNRGNQAANGNTSGTPASESNLLDLRNLPGGKNFRNTGNSAGATGNGVVLSPSRSYFLTDYRFAETLTLTEDLLTNPKVQPLILNEFQPYEMISPGDVLNGVGDGIMKIIGGTVGTLATPIIKGAGKVIQNKLIDLYASKTSELYKEGGSRKKKMFTADPVQVVQNMFMGGRWLNTYELPYFGGHYLKSNYSKNWTLGDSSGFLGKGLTGDGEGSAGTKMMGIDFPSNPKFKANMAESREPIQIEFFLINTDNEWLKRNFQFLNAIYAGSNWLHLKYCFIRPPNVYHIVCPGRFQIYWAAIDVTVTFEGKLRKNVAVSQSLKTYSKAITDDMLWPDAWKININIRDLTPNNFNLYAEYYLNGLNTDELAQFEGSQADNLAGTINDLKEYWTSMMDDKNVAAAMNSVKSGAKASWEAAKSLTSDVFGKMAGNSSLTDEELKAREDAKKGNK